MNCLFIVRPMTVAHGEINVENNLDVIQHAAQLKAARSTHSINDVITCFTFNRRSESSASITQKIHLVQNIFCTK